MLQQIQGELIRLRADEIVTNVDDEFAPHIGSLVRVERREAVWHLLPPELLGLLKELPSNAGSGAVQQAIEEKGQFVWHGHSPSGQRDSGEAGSPENDG